MKVVATAALFKAEAAYETALCLWQASKMFGWSDSQTPAEIQEAYGAAVKEYVVTMDQAELNRCQSLQGPTNDFAAGEEGAYVTEQQAIAAANRTCATARRTRTRPAATPSPRPRPPTSRRWRASRGRWPRTSISTTRICGWRWRVTSNRAYAYADAYENYAEDTAADAATQDTAISAALQTQANADAAAGQTLGDALAAADQTEQNAIAAADQTQVQTPTRQRRPPSRGPWRQPPPAIRSGYLIPSRTDWPLKSEGRSSCCSWTSSGNASAISWSLRYGDRDATNRKTTGFCCHPTEYVAAGCRCRTRISRL